MRLLEFDSFNRHFRVLIRTTLEYRGESTGLPELLFVVINPLTLIQSDRVIHGQLPKRKDSFRSRYDRTGEIVESAYDPLATAEMQSSALSRKAARAVEI